MLAAIEFVAWSFWELEDTVDEACFLLVTAVVAAVDCSFLGTTFFLVVELGFGA